MKISKNLIAIYGAGGHASVVADIALLNGYDKILFIDDGLEGYIGFDEYYAEHSNSIPIIVAIGSNTIRSKIVLKLEAYSFNIVTLIHPRSVIAESVSIGIGSVVMANCVINPNSIIGKGVILNTSSVIEHDNNIGDFAHISPNAALGGGVVVGSYTHIGIGTSVIPYVNIGANCVVGAGSVVNKDLPENIVAYGVPARVVRNN